MIKEFLSAEDAKMRLHRTVCMYKNEPVYITDTSRAKVTYQRLSDGFVDTIFIADENFCTKSPPLGYINFMRNAWYLAREPARRQKQGLNAESIRSYPDGKIMGYNFIVSPEMHKCIVGDYPSKAEAISNVREGGHKSCAFHRNLCIRMLDRTTMGMYFKTRLIATKNIYALGDNFNPIESKDLSIICGHLSDEGINLW